MACKWCQQVTDNEQKYAWASCKVETLKKHETSVQHQKSSAIMKAQRAPPGETKSEKAIEKINKATIDKLSLLFRNCHALAVNGRPFTDFTWISKLDNIKGLNVGSTYLNDHAARSFTRCIAEIEVLKTKSNMDEASFFAILSDGSTDVSVCENEMFFVRFAVGGEVKVKLTILEFK